MYPRRQNHLSDRWIIAGAVALSFTAGFANAATLQVGSLAVSHLTGSISRVSIEISQGDYHEVAPFMGIVGGFFLGAVVCGMVVGNKELGFGRRYAVMMFVEGILFALAAALALHGSSRWSLGTAACACGLQNAMASSFHGLVVRTTHMTGLITDLAFQIGKVLTGHKPDSEQFGIQIPIVLAFGLGGIIGALAEVPWGSYSLLLAALLACANGVGYLLVRKNLDRMSLPPTFQVPKPP